MSSTKRQTVAQLFGRETFLLHFNILFNFELNFK
jgi:hypothetical protein